MAWLEDFTAFAQSRVSDEIVDALNVRGVSDDQIRAFSIGYVNKEIPSLEYPESFLKWCHNGAKLEDVYCFPLTNPIGEVRGFQFRPVQRELRGYSDFMLDSGDAIGFGLAQAMPHIWDRLSANLVEGVFDFFPIQRHRPETLATMGAHVPEPLVRTLVRMRCGRIVFGFDNDHTGRKTVEQFIKDHAKQPFGPFTTLDLKYPKLPMPNGKTSKDPGDIWELGGDMKVAEFLNRYVPPFV